MRGHENLIPINRRAKDEQRELRLKAGKRSGEVRRERKTFREALKEALKIEGVQDSILLALLDKAKMGDTKAFEVIRDTIGEKPVNETNISGTIDIKKVLVEFVDK